MGKSGCTSMNARAYIPDSLLFGMPAGVYTLTRSMPQLGEPRLRI